MKLWCLDINILKYEISIKLACCMVLINCFPLCNIYYIYIAMYNLYHDIFFKQYYSF